MIIPRLALRNLARNRKSSLALLSLVAVGVFIFLLGDSALGAAAKGITSEFRDGYTGDLVIKAKSERQFGIFGYSVPVIGDYEAVPNLSESPRIKEILRGLPGVRGCTGLVSGAALLEGQGGYQVKVPVFGVVAADYFPLFPGIKVVAGALPADTEAWIVLPKSRAEEIGKAEGRKLAIGETLQFTMASGNAFTIRAVRLRAIVEPSFTTYTEAVPVYTDVGTLRALLGLSLGNKESGSAAVPSGGSGSFDMDSFFAAPAAMPSEGNTQSPETGLELVQSYLGHEDDRGKIEATAIDPERGSWHFLLVRLAPGARERSVQNSLNAALGKEKIAAVAGGWLGSAGLNAELLFLIKTVFEIGIGILAVVIVLVLTNGLAFSVMEQSKEIGTMRSMGAQRSFVQRLYSLESLFLVLSGAAAGSALAAAVLRAIGKDGIPIGNSYLVMLFGGTAVRPEMSLATLIWTLAFMCVIALVSAAYPITLASRASLAQSMTAE
jgi:putative ABC transport system permease protein